MKKSDIKKIEEFVKSRLDELNWVHTEGVRVVGRELAELENADKDVVDMVILFHDIAKTDEENHAKRGAEICKKYLSGLNFDMEFIKRVAHCVEAHSTPWHKRKYKIMPSTIEAKVVFDADMLQQLSPFGIIKHILEYSNEPYSIIVSKSMKTLEKAYSLLLTENGKRIGKEKIKTVEEFFEEA